MKMGLGGREVVLMGWKVGSGGIWRFETGDPSLSLLLSLSRDKWWCMYLGAGCVVNAVHLDGAKAELGAVVYLTSIKRPSATASSLFSWNYSFLNRVPIIPWSNCSAASMSPASDRGIFASLIPCMGTGFVLSTLSISVQTVRFRLFLLWSFGSLQRFIQHSNCKQSNQTSLEF